MARFSNDTGAMIGHLDWYDCDKCLYCDPDKGGCDIAIEEWRDGLNTDGDFVYCGCFKDRDAEEEEPEPNPDQLVLEVAS